MRVKIFPSIPKGTIIVPSSKSMAHRAMISASLSKGKSVIKNISFSEDINTTLNAVKMLSTEYPVDNNTIIMNSKGIISPSEKLVIDCNESGSTLRFLIPIFSLLNKEVVFVGSKRLLERPQTVYKEIFLKQGLIFKQDNDRITINGCLKPGEYQVEGNISSQFISGLLFTLPLLNDNSIIKINPPFESRSYVELTIEVLKHFGVEVFFIDNDTIMVKGNQAYQPTEYSVEGDYSQAAFFACLAAIQGNTNIINLKKNSLQGDKTIIDILSSFGADIKPINDGFRVKSAMLKATEIDLSNCPDLGPILMVLASFSHGRTVIKNANRLRIKESDRILSMETELKKLNVNITSTENEIIINGRKPLKREVEVFAHNDHRIAMSLAVFGAVSEYPITIDGAECVKKSYPTFFEDLESIHIKLQRN